MDTGDSSQAHEITIRGLYKRDTPALIEMIERSPGDFDVRKFREWMQNMFGALGGKHTRIFVAEDAEGTLHGYVAYEITRTQNEKRFLMYDCFVRDESRLQEIGTKLLYGMISGGPMYAMQIKIADAIASLEAPGTMPQWSSTDTFIADDNIGALTFLTKRRFRSSGNTAQGKIKLSYEGDKD